MQELESRISGFTDSQVKECLIPFLMRKKPDKSAMQAKCLIYRLRPFCI